MNFFEANLFTHKGEYEEAFKRFVEANHIKSNEISSVVKNLTQNYYKIVNRMQRWSPHTQKQTEYSLKKLFLLVILSIVSFIPGIFSYAIFNNKFSIFYIFVLFII